MLGARAGGAVDDAARVAGDEGDRVPAHARQVAEDLRDRQGEGALVVAVGRLGGHGAAGVHRQDEGEVGLALVALDDGLAGAGGGLPVDVGHVVAGAVGGQVVEVLAVADEHGAVPPVEQAGGPPQGGQLQAAAHAGQPGGAPGGPGRPRGPCGPLGAVGGGVRVRGHGAQGVGTAEKTASMIVSGATPSARAS